MTAPEVAPPWALLAELTHRCPLHCAYCSNPVELVKRDAELSTEDWARVMREAAALGVVSTHLSGGEPLRRADLEQIVAATAGAGIHSQMVTSGVGLDERRLGRLVDAGLNCVQLSVQHADLRANDEIAGARVFAAKERAAALVRKTGIVLGLNVVLHRQNLDAIDDIIALGIAWGCSRIELANAQYQGWALLNRAALLPSREQLARAEDAVGRWRERLAGSVELIWVLPDYFTGVPKPCMGGWGALSLTVAPDGTVLPCPGAYVITELDFPNVRNASLAEIWRRSPAFAAYRGDAWMPDPCRSCPRRAEDFGGCRCQARALTGDAARTDPACTLSPDHHLIEARTAPSSGGPGREPAASPAPVVPRILRS
ncbi:pyrroloquinoline quinone biosynthesis protein PqqE [Actinomadura rupiterrae]|uniref:pyrroloquinoline quinone biosynthesis protein PqqE n=1 Tax=Actinomadura rupiterrae TaxID=559627 RepID=UPI0020A4B894|nr:pyrroloquinoline quinone biosynthesis protein PqqE [Actinomadura rupiterrae]MCP2341058.1 pyrroloquinoline quinone biosynthesis protein E [Actinomadura rupiterrae]